MSSLVLCSYKQPMEGSKFRWGVLSDTRDTKKEPLSLKTIKGMYRKFEIVRPPILIGLFISLANALCCICLVI